MAIFYPDILEHNNSNFALVDATQLRGNAYPLADLADTGSIPSDKRQVGTVVFTSGSGKYYGFTGDDVANWDTPANWSEFVLSGVSGTDLNGIFSGSFSGSFQGDGSLLTGLVTELTISDGSATDTVDLLTDTLTFTNASTHGFTFSVTDNTVTLNTPQDLQTTASPTFAGATAGNIKIGVTGDNEIDTTSGNLTLDSAGGTTTIDDNASVTGTLTVTNATDLNSTVAINGDITLDGSGAQSIVHTGTSGLTISSNNGTVTVERSIFDGNNLTVPGNLTVQGTTTTVDSTTVNIGDNIIVLNAAGAVADGGIQVIDPVDTEGTGSLLWNASSDYWYAGVSGSTHFRLATFTNATPSTNAVPRIDSNKRLVAGSITDTSTAVTVSTATTLQSTLEVDGIVQLDSAGGSDDGNHTSAVSFRNQSNQIGYISTTESTDVLDGVLGYKASDGTLVFSTVIDGGTF